MNAGLGDMDSVGIELKQVGVLVEITARRAHGRKNLDGHTEQLDHQPVQSYRGHWHIFLSEICSTSGAKQARAGDVDESWKLGHSLVSCADCLVLTACHHNSRHRSKCLLHSAPPEWLSGARGLAHLERVLYEQAAHAGLPGPSSTLISHRY